MKDIGVLVKLNNLMKRMELVKYLIGDWKSTNNKYINMTEQIAYVQKKLELLDESKIVYFQKRADILKQEVEELLQQRQNDPGNDVLNKRANELGHKKEVIDTLYKNTKSVKHISEQIPSYVDRLEQKRKVHDMAAHILLTIERMEKQQQNILNSAAKDNKQVIDALQKGMKENQETIKDNILMLKQKIGVKEK